MLVDDFSPQAVQGGINVLTNGAAVTFDVLDGYDTRDLSEWRWILAMLCIRACYGYAFAAREHLYMMWRRST